MDQYWEGEEAEEEVAEDFTADLHLVDAFGVEVSVDDVDGGRNLFNLLVEGHDEFLELTVVEDAMPD